MEEDADQTAYVYDDSFSIIVQMRNTIMHVHDVGYKFNVNFYSLQASSLHFNVCTLCCSLNQDPSYISAVLHGCRLYCIIYQYCRSLRGVCMGMHETNYSYAACMVKSGRVWEMPCTCIHSMSNEMLWN